MTSTTVASPDGTLYERLLSAHPALIENTDRDAWDPYPGSFAAGLAGNGDGDPLAGLSWVTNYAGQEEFGAAALVTALTGQVGRNFAMVGGAKAHVAVIDSLPGHGDEACALVLSKHRLFEPPTDGTCQRLTWGDDVSRYGSDALEYMTAYRTQVLWAQGLPSRLDWEKMPDLRRLARGMGITPLPKRKADLLTAITAHPDFGALAERPTMWPALFATGETLVLRADRGPSALIVRNLIAAADAGTLGVGNGSGPFSTGLFFYDTRDEHPSMVAEREAAFDYYDSRMPAAAQLAADLTADGYRVRTLDRPCVINPQNRFEEPREVFWVDVSLGRDNIFGYFTDEEIRHRSLAPERN